VEGEATIALARGLIAHGSDGIVYSIDPHTGSSETPNQDTLAEFSENIRRAGVADVVESIRLHSFAARPQFRSASIHVLFVDGSHEYRDVLRDLTEWSATLAVGAVLALNDPSAPGVYRAIRETILQRVTAFRHPRLIANTLFVDFIPSMGWTRSDSIALAKAGVTLAPQAVAAMYVRPYMPTWVVRLGHRVSRRLIGG
jgi:predicted O-methyltransferase YrrM